MYNRVGGWGKNEVKAGKEVLTLLSASAEATRAIGARLGRRASAGDVICLEGELGAGKTTFIQGMGEGMGIEVPITSPSFVLVREYRGKDGRPRLYHIDLYRISFIQEALLLGLEDYLYGDGISAIEWAEKVAEILPRERLWVRLEYWGEGKRKLFFRAKGERYRALLEEVGEACS